MSLPFKDGAKMHRQSGQAAKSLLLKSGSSLPAWLQKWGFCRRLMSIFPRSLHFELFCNGFC
jgi:hypothetical protein